MWQANAQLQMARQLITLAASVPEAQVRCNALAQLWRCVVDSEVAVRLAHTRAERISGQAELKHLLSDAGVFDLISGSLPGEVTPARIFTCSWSALALAGQHAGSQTISVPCDRQALWTFCTSTRAWCCHAGRPA